MNDRARNSPSAARGALSDAELLALFIGSGRRGANAVDIGRELLLQSGNLRSLLDQELPALAAHARSGARPKRHGCTRRSNWAGAISQAKVKRSVSLNPAACADYLKSRLAGYPYEVFACLFMDIHHRVITFEELVRGSIAGADVPIREVVRRCLAHNAACVIFAHNHPSGIAEASRDDRELTQKLKTGAEPDRREGARPLHHRLRQDAVVFRTRPDGRNAVP